MTKERLFPQNLFSQLQQKNDSFTRASLCSGPINVIKSISEVFMLRLLEVNNELN